MGAGASLACLEGGIHGGGWECVAKGGPVHATRRHTGKVVCMVRVHSCSEPCNSRATLQKYYIKSYVLESISFYFCSTAKPHNPSTSTRYILYIHQN